MGAAVLLHWHYLIFLVPCSLSAMLLLLSSLSGGHRHGLDGGHGHIAIHGHAHAAVGHGHGPVDVVHHAAPSAHPTAAHGQAHSSANDPAHHHEGTVRGGDHDRRTAEQPVQTQSHTLVAMLGIGRAPLPMIIEGFFLVWGFSGCILNQIMLKGISSPSLLQALPVMALAAGCGLAGARIAAEVIGRIMPQEESLVVSRHGLFGLKGKIVFPVSETSGRIMVYDDHGSLHDESCRIAPGQQPIERGHSAIVLDRDAKGNLVVEEIPD